ncbi:MAG: CocE/NonD family hydrolase [Clostridiales bacterium]|nr:CocE/NonD family hydrolase [Clostridiales bacterium]
MKEIENVWIPLSDGTRLAARVWRPVDGTAGPVPAVLEYLPYRKDDCTALDDAMRHPYFAAHGYASVRVDLRGTGSSDGLLAGEYLAQEHDDALEVIEWLAEQPWCDGSVGMIGYSWGGFNALQVAARRPPRLRAIITHASTDDRYRDDCHYMGGCLLASDMLKWAASMLTYPIQPPDPRFAGPRWREMWMHRLVNAPHLARDWISHQRRDAFWKHGSVAEEYGAIECPVMVVGGWADAYTNAVPRLLEHLDVPRLGLIGPWGHMFPYEGVPGPAIGFLHEAVRWWDHWLKGIDNDVMDEPLLRAWIEEWVAPATFHATRPGRWVAEERWPPALVSTSAYRLTSRGTLSAGESAHKTPGEPAWPELLLPSNQECGQAAGVWCANGGPDEIAGDQRPDDERSLTFTTQPLDAPLDVLGHPVVRVRVRVDQPLALIAVRLEDVAPDGSSLLVSWGMLNLTHREGHESPVACVPNAQMDVRIESRVCGYRFSAGHRIRLALSPTYWPHAWPSPEPLEMRVAVDGPSSLELPVRDSKADAGRAEPAFEPPEVAAAQSPHANTGTEPPVPGRTRTVTVEDGTHTITDRERRARTIPATGARYTESSSDVYVITEGKPLSATVRCARETRSESTDLTWSVRVISEMTCDARYFHVTETYAANENERLVYERRRAYRIPRDFV